MKADLSISSAFQNVFEGGPDAEPPTAERAWAPPSPADVRRGREQVYSGLRIPQIEASSSDPAIEVYVRINAAKRPASTDLVFIIGTDVAPFPQGGMTFVNVDSSQFVLDSKRNEDGHKFLARLASAVGDAGFNVSYERSAGAGPVIARIRVRRPENG